MPVNLKWKIKYLNNSVHLLNTQRLSNRSNRCQIETRHREASKKVLVDEGSVEDVERDAKDGRDVADGELQAVFERGVDDVLVEDVSSLKRKIEISRDFS